MDALKVFESVLREVNRFEAAEINYLDFNYWIEKGASKFIRDELKSYEQTQVLTDALRTILKEVEVEVNASSTTDARDITLAEDYRHFNKGLVTFKYKTATPRFAINSLRKIYTKRLTGDAEAFIHENYYMQPFISDNDSRVYHRVFGDKVRIHFEPDALVPENIVFINKLRYEYFSNPLAIELGVSGSDLVSVQGSVFPEEATREIINITAGLIHEKSGRTNKFQTHSIVNQ